MGDLIYGLSIRGIDSIMVNSSRNGMAVQSSKYGWTRYESIYPIMPRWCGCGSLLPKNNRKRAAVEIHDHLHLKGDGI